MRKFEASSTVTGSDREKWVQSHMGFVCGIWFTQTEKLLAESETNVTRGGGVFESLLIGARL